MARAYSLKATTEHLEDALNDIATLYKAGCLNWKGNTKEGLSYSEVIAEHLLKLRVKEALSQIPPIKRADYNVEHDGIIQNDSNRHEEKFAIGVHKKDLPFLGKIINYQVPLKARQSDKAGKIDLIAYRENPKNALIVELKFKDNAETLLRAAIEISTYYHMLSHENFLASYKEFKELKPRNIRKAVLLGEDTQSYEDARNIENLPNVRRLLQKLEVEIYGLCLVEGHFEIERIAL